MTLSQKWLVFNATQTCHDEDSDMGSDTGGDSGSDIGTDTDSDTGSDNTVDPDSDLHRPDDSPAVFLPLRKV